MRCCRGDSSPSTHPPPGPKAAHADNQKLPEPGDTLSRPVSEASLNTLARRRRPPPSRDRGSRGPAAEDAPSPDAEPAQAEAWAARGERTREPASPPRRCSRPRPSSAPPETLQPAVTVKPAYPPRSPPPSPAPRRRTASYTTTGGLRLPTRPRAPLERAQKAPRGCSDLASCGCRVMLYSLLN